MPTSAAYNKQGFTLIEVLMGLLIIAILATLLSRILQSSLLTNQIMKEEKQNATLQQDQFYLQLAGEREEPILELTPLDEEEE